MAEPKPLEIPIPGVGMRYRGDARDMFALLRIYRTLSGESLLVWNGTDREHYERAMKVTVHPDKSVEAVLTLGGTAAYKPASTDMAATLGLDEGATVEDVDDEISRHILAY